MSSDKNFCFWLERVGYNIGMLVCWLAKYESEWDKIGEIKIVVLMAVFLEAFQQQNCHGINFWFLLGLLVLDQRQITYSFSELCIKWCFFLKSSITFAANTTIKIFYPSCFRRGGEECCSLRVFKLLVGVAISSAWCHLCCHMQLVSWHIFLFDLLVTLIADWIPQPWRQHQSILEI